MSAKRKTVAGAAGGSGDPSEPLPLREWGREVRELEREISVLEQRLDEQKAAAAITKSEVKKLTAELRNAIRGRLQERFSFAGSLTNDDANKVLVDRKTGELVPEPA